MSKLSIILILAIVLLIALMGWLFSPAHAHSWYPPDCCAGDDEHGDCHPVACEELTELPNNHWRWKEFEFDRVLPTKDSHCHVCIGMFHENGKTIPRYPHCIFIQQGV